MTLRTTRTLSLAIAFALVTTTAWAQAALGSRTSIDVSGANPQDVLASLAKTLDCTLDVQAELQGPVTLKVSNITVRTALTVLCETLGCSWTLEGGSLRVRPARVDAQVKSNVVKGQLNAKAVLEKFKRDTGPAQRFEKTKVRDVLAALSKIADMDITTEEPLASREITADLSNRTIEVALRDIMKAAGIEKVGYMTGSDSEGGRARLKIMVKGARLPG